MSGENGCGGEAVQRVQFKKERETKKRLRETEVYMINRNIIQTVRKWSTVRVIFYFITIVIILGCINL